MSKIFMIIYLTVGFSSGAEAGQIYKGMLAKCSGLYELDGRIGECFDNPAAAMAAVECLGYLKAEWKKAKKISKQLSSNTYKDAHSQQEKEYILSTSDQKKLQEKLNDLLDATEYAGDLIFKYPSVMARSTGALNYEELGPCWKDNFEVVKNVLSDIDDMIIEGNAADEKSLAMMGAVEGYDSNVGSLSTQNVVPLNATTETSSHKKGNKRNISTITENPEGKVKVAKSKKVKSKKKPSARKTKSISST